MKKISRSEKLKIYEKIKTLVLILLVTVAVFLGYRVFEIYSSQTTANSTDQSNTSLGFAEDTAGGTEEAQLKDFCHWSGAEVVMANTPGGRCKISNSDDLYVVFEEAFSLIRDAYLKDSNSLSLSTKAEWTNNLGKNSLYLKYPSKRFTSFEAAFNNAPSSHLASLISDYTEIVFVPDNEGRLTLLLRGEDGSKFVKIKTDWISEKINSIILEYKQKGDPNLKFAYELDLADHSLIPNPMFLTYDSGISVPDIIANVPRIYKSGLNFTKTTDFTTGLIQIFGYNPNTVRQYVNSDGTLIFVGETGTLSIYQHGKIEYKSLAASEGIQLKRSSQPAEYSASLKICEIVEKIFKISGIDPDNSSFNLKLTKMPFSFEQSNAEEIHFDYFADDILIDFGNESAISAVVEDGKLTELKMHIKNIELLSSQSNLPNFWEGTDSFSGGSSIPVKLIYKFNNIKEPIEANWQSWGGIIEYGFKTT
ncbi:MAG: hypothetical protein IJV86_05610 [Clostridia bacterium]|nr:hypothetical protein [Clostridia bacterium]MBQ9737855.1 hypothetical protein [Clostridia bacterium]